MSFAALPRKCDRYEKVVGRSALNWKVTISINGGQVIKNFYARTEERAEEKAEDWIEAHWPGATGRHQQPPYD